MIVEDEPLNRQLLLTIFAHMGHQAFEAANGLEALALLAERPAMHAMLLDLNMTPIDGFTVLKRLREQPETRDLPVICISAYARQEDQDQALRAGAQAYVVKPFRRRELIAAIDAVLLHAGTLLPGQTIDQARRSSARLL
ncbi:Phosphate regulon transcriptional regulatory protein PhoB [compost metagenome]